VIVVSADAPDRAASSPRPSIAFAAVAKGTDLDTLVYVIEADGRGLRRLA